MCVPVCFQLYATKNLCDIFLPEILLRVVLSMCDATLDSKGEKDLFPQSFYLFIYFILFYFIRASREAYGTSQARESMTDF